MMKTQYPWRWAVVLAALTLAFAGTAIAQVGTGNLYGVILDEQGSPLPGVTVELTGKGAPAVQVVEQGQTLGEGSGRSKKQAETAAALAALKTEVWTKENRADLP